MKTARHVVSIHSRADISCIAVHAFSFQTLSTRLIMLIFLLAAAIVSPRIVHADQPAASKLPTVVTPTDSSLKENLTDNSFVEKSAENLLKDSELSKVALKKTSNAKLKEFAQRIADGSKSSLQQLNQVATAHQLRVPTQLSPEQHATLDQLQVLKNEEFDQTYVSVMKKSQDALVGLYDNASGQATLKSELRQLAAQQLPALRQNQKLAHALSQPAAATP